MDNIIDFKTGKPICVDKQAFEILKILATPTQKVVVQPLPWRKIDTAYMILIILASIGLGWSLCSILSK
jgi:hypothetical protein